MVEGSEPLVISLSLLPSDLFTESPLVVQCSVRSLIDKKRQIHFTSLLDTSATGIAFVDVAMMRHVCKMLHILFISLAKPKLVRGFDGQLASNSHISHVDSARSFKTACFNACD